jgi:hypothetical protein
LSDKVWGWDEIGAYVGKSGRTAMRYAHKRRLLVHKMPGGGPKAPVYAFKHELDLWLSGGQHGIARRAQGHTETHTDEIAAPVLKRILRIGQETKLYRRNYVLHFDLRPALRGVEVKLDYSYELCNSAETVETFTQEVTVDDSDHGFVEKMSFLANGKSVYVLKKPAPTRKFIGYVSYQGPQRKIQPAWSRMVYLCRASMVIHRSNDDIWYNHMIMPTVGVKIETKATAGFEITKSFSIPGLVMKAEHLDVAWRKLK